MRGWPRHPDVNLVSARRFQRQQGSPAIKAILAGASASSSIPGRRSATGMSWQCSSGADGAQRHLDALL